MGRILERRLEKWGHTGKKMHAPVSSGALAFLRVSPKKRRGHHSRDRTWNEVAKAMVKMEAERETIKTRLLYNEKEAMDGKRGKNGSDILATCL